MHNQPSGAAYDVVLLLHVACVVVGIVTIATGAATARRLGRLARTAAPLPEPLRRYFRPGVNWAGRTIYGIPVFGFALIGMSQGAYAVTDGWVLSGLVIFVALAFLAEGVLWPAERRIQASVSSGSATTTTTATSDAASTSQSAPGDGPAAEPDARGDSAPVLRDAQLIVWSAAAALVLLLVGTVLMVAQP
jgi:hypothetical protein